MSRIVSSLTPQTSKVSTSAADLGPTLSATVNPFKVTDGFSPAGTKSLILRSLPPPMPNSAAGTKEAQDQFNDKVSQIFGQTAESLAAGNPPVRDPAQLSKANKDELVKATGDYLLGMPVSAFSPRFVAGLNTELNRAGVSNVDLASTRLSDLGPVAAKYVAKRAEELQNAQPGVFYGLAVVGAAAAGYQGGSAGLEQLGIKPEFTQSFFDKAVVVRAAATWKPGFEDLQLTADVQGTVKLGEEATIGASVTSVNGGRASLVGNVTSSDIQAGANVTVDRTGVSGGASVTLGLPNAPVRGEVTATFGPGGVKGDARVEVGDTRLGGAITVGADQQGVNRAEIEGRYSNLEGLAITASASQERGEGVTVSGEVEHTMGENKVFALVKSSSSGTEAKVGLEIKFK